jgi:uncharacterized membrane protein
MSIKNQPFKLSPAREELALERIMFFSDAVMAIAITLLAIDLKLPELPTPLALAEFSTSLSALTPRLISFVISFVVIGIFWASHHRYFTYIIRYDGRLIALNLLFLLFIALMPFVASLFGQFYLIKFSVIVYALEVTAIGLSIGGIWWYASSNHRLIDPELEPEFIRVRNIIALIVPLIFLVSIPFALINPLLPIIVWWTTPILLVLPLQKAQQKESKRKV